MGLHGLEQGYLYFTFYSSPSNTLSKSSVALYNLQFLCSVFVESLSPSLALESGISVSLCSVSLAGMLYIASSRTG
jgi:hypothetical protein